MTFGRRLRTAIKSGLHSLFRLGQRAGVNILPAHFYSSVPDLRDLAARSDWRAPRSMVGVAGADPAAQAAFLDTLVTPAIAETLRNREIHAEAVAANRVDSGYGEIEAEVLYAFIRTRRPGRIVQVGCGVSTAAIQIAARDEGYSPRITCIDPFPTAFLRDEAGAGRIELVAEPAQTVPLGTLTGLGAGDLLFVDSTHTVKPGSEVNRIVLEVLPRLAPGVLVHFHDIFFPYDHGRGVLSEDLFFHCESVLLHAYLADNPACRVLCAMSMLHYALPDRIAALFPRYDPQGSRDGMRAPGGRHFPSSIFLERTGAAEAGG